MVMTVSLFFSFFYYIIVTFKEKYAIFKISNVTFKPLRRRKSYRMKPKASSVTAEIL